MNLSQEDFNASLGTWGDCVNPEGSVKYNAPTGYYFYACTCRVEGSKIASCEKIIKGEISVDTTDSYIVISMLQGEYHPFVNKIVSVTLTGNIDQMQYWLKPI